MGLHSQIGITNSHPMVFDCQLFDHCTVSVCNDRHDSHSHVEKRYHTLQQRRRFGAQLFFIGRLNSSMSFLRLFRTRWKKNSVGNCECSLLHRYDYAHFCPVRVHGDVFRPPKHGLLLSVLVGNGIQIAFMSFITLGKKL